MAQAVDHITLHGKSLTDSTMLELEGYLGRLQIRMSRVEEASGVTSGTGGGVQTGSFLTRQVADSLYAPSSVLSGINGTDDRVAVFSGSSSLTGGNLQDDGHYLTMAPDGIPIDASAWNISRFRIGSLLNTASGPLDASEASLHVQVKTSQATNSIISYEKMGMLIYAQSVDPSDYVTIPNITRDIVGLDTRAGILNPSTTGRAWGLYSEAATDSAADGLLIGGEFSLFNQGSEEPNVGILSKHALSLNCHPNRGTTGVEIQDKFFHGVHAAQQSVSVSFLRLTKVAVLTTLFLVRPDGQTLIGDYASGGSLSNYDSRYGMLSVADTITVIDSGTNKHILQIWSDSLNSLHRINANKYDGSVAYWPVSLEVAGNQIIKLTTDTRAVIAAPSTAPSSGDLFNGSISAWLDESGNLLTFKVKYSGGTVKSGTVAVV